MRRIIVLQRALIPMIMLFGRRDEPTDAVRDYADRLSEALRRHGVICESSEVRWHEQGWCAALAKLWKQSRAWRGRWVVLHYTALMWSRRGFPMALPLALHILKRRGCRIGVVLHDPNPAPATCWAGRFRAGLQERIARYLSGNACLAFFALPLECLPWLPAQRTQSLFIPIGANIPSWEDLERDGFIRVPNSVPTVGVFGVSTWPAAQQREVETIVHAVRSASAKVGHVQLVVLGRGAKEAESLLRNGFSGSEVRLTVAGVRSALEISTELAGCDVLLFARGALSSRRGSALAGIACGLPVVAYRGDETAFPVTEAGIVFVSQDDLASLGNELAALLLDRDRRLALSARNFAVFRQWFSWDRIAERWIEALGREQLVAR